MPTRIVRWVEGTTADEVIVWNRLKRFSGRLAGDTISHDFADDRRTDFEVGDVPAFISEQLLPVRKAEMHFLGTLRHFLKGTLVRWHYDAEAAIVWWDESFSIGGEDITKRRESQDRTLCQAAHEIVKAVADMTSTTDRPVWPHDFTLPPEGDNVRPEL